MSNFWQRVITGFFFTATIIGAIWFGPTSFRLLFLLTALLSLREYYHLIGADARKPQKKAGLFAGALLYVSIAFSADLFGHLSQPEVLVMPAIALVFFAELYRKQSDPFGNIAHTVTGILYTVLPFALLCNMSMQHGTYDATILLGYFLLIWCSDSFAYVFGNLMGKTRLFERISPKKSWEGSIGGGLSTLGVAYILSIYFTAYSLMDWLVIALLVVVTGTLGDLSESMLKRSLNVKDSGNILPGHGGMLDRFDAVLLSVPFVWAYLSLFHQHH